MKPKAVAKVAGMLIMDAMRYDKLKMRMKPLFNGAISVATIFVISSPTTSCGGREETTKIVMIAVASSVKEQIIDALPTATFGCRNNENRVAKKLILTIFE